MKPLLISMLALSLGGCASLHVKVSVINPTVIEDEVDRVMLRNILPQVAAMGPADVELQIQNLEDKHAELYAAANTRLRTECSDPVKKALLDIYCQINLQQEFNKHISPAYATFKTDAKAKQALVASLNASYSQAKDEATGAPIKAKLTVALRDYVFSFRNFAWRVRSDVAGMPGEKGMGGLIEAMEALAKANPVNPVSATILQKQQQVVATLQTLLDKQGLGSDVYAYAVASADDDLWADKYNYTKASGNFGAADIAIRMQSLDNFTIKGLAFDPADVAQMASKIISQSIMLAAQISGVPIQSTDTTGLGKASTEVGKLEETLLQRRAELADQRAALLDIAAAIDREVGSIRNKNKRLGAISAIRAVYDAHASRLSSGGN